MAAREFSRLDRVQATVRKALAEPINALARARAVGLATVTEVALSPDFRYGTIFLSVYGETAVRDQFLRHVRDRASALQAVLAKSLRTRHVPVLTFELDDSIERGARISQILRSPAGPVGE